MKLEKQFLIIIYKKYWDLVKEDVYNIVQEFYNQTLNLTKFNNASIILIPKSVESNTIDQYRSISLINYSVKIITKILDNRMTPGFTNRQISNILCIR
jgi:hypothetical protein